MSVKERFRTLARDLTSLEINTIRRASITGESMPDPRHALHDVASEYNSALNKLLRGDPRRVQGERWSLACRFSRPAYRAGDTCEVVVTVLDEQGKPLVDEPVEAWLCPAPAVEAIEGQGRARVRLAPPAPLALPARRTDAQGRATLSHPVSRDDGPCTAIKLKVREKTVEMHIPLAKVRGSLLAFYSLNHRAHEAGDGPEDGLEVKPWLLRRIELSAVRLATLLETLEPPKGMKGCDANDYSRRHLNGAPEEGETGDRAAPPSLKLAPSDLVTLRKIWELGCEEILMQTVVQLDGDVVTRLSEDAAQEEASLIHRIHAEGVRVATQSWQHLVDSLSSFARVLFK